MVDIWIQLGRFWNRRKARAKSQGQAVNAFLSRRCLLSIFTDWSAYSSDVDASASMGWNSLTWVEMFSSSILMGVARHRADRKLSERVYATDACHRTHRGVQQAGVGVCYADYSGKRKTIVESKITQLLLTKGWATGMWNGEYFQDSIDFGDDEETVPDRHRLVEYFTEKELDQVHWSHVTSTAYVSNAHINFHECNGVLMGVRHRARTKSAHGCIGIHITDSGVCLGGILKGRSSSLYLNTIYRQICAYSLCADLHIASCYVRSELNKVADWLSRIALV